MNVFKEIYSKIFSLQEKCFNLYVFIQKGFAEVILPKSDVISRRFSHFEYISHFTKYKMPNISKKD